MEAWVFYLMILILAGSMLGLYFGLVGTKQQSAEKRDAMFTALGITTAIMLVYAFISLYFFTSNTEYVYPYLLIMTSLNMLLSVGALGISMINVTY